MTRTKINFQTSLELVSEPRPQKHRAWCGARKMIIPKKRAADKSYPRTQVKTWQLDLSMTCWVVKTHSNQQTAGSGFAAHEIDHLLAQQSDLQSLFSVPPC